MRTRGAVPKTAPAFPRKHYLLHAKTTSTSLDPQNQERYSENEEYISANQFMINFYTRVSNDATYELQDPQGLFDHLHLLK
eukprot:5121256-Amphidinium_carterae.1